MSRIICGLCDKELTKSGEPHECRTFSEMFWGRGADNLTEPEEIPQHKHFTVHLPWGVVSMKDMYYLHEDKEVGRLVCAFALNTDLDIVEVSSTDYEVEVDEGSPEVDFYVGECTCSARHESDGLEYSRFPENMIITKDYF
jgi:hypothetical protein